jgi:hypothetical protein
MREAKLMLDEGLISPEDYASLKASVLTNLVTSPR